MVIARLLLQGRYEVLVKDHGTAGEFELLAHYYDPTNSYSTQLYHHHHDCDYHLGLYFLT